MTLTLAIASEGQLYDPSLEFMAACGMPVRRASSRRYTAVVGNIPEELRDVQAHIYDMTPTPILTHDWSGSVTGDIAELEITVENLGTKAAEDFHVVAGFDAGNGTLWNAEESENTTLPVGQQVTIIISLQTPRGKHTRLVVQIIHEGYAVDESYSDWFDT